MFYQGFETKLISLLNQYLFLNVFLMFQNTNFQYSLSFEFLPVVSVGDPKVDQI